MELDGERGTIVGAVPELSKLKPLSPSQIATALDCLRKWGRESLDGVKSPDKPSTILGQQTHTQAENWLGKGERPALTLPGRIFESGAHLWPAPGSRPFIIEDTVQFTALGISFHGRLDVAYDDDDSILTIGDHKTTSDPKWAKTSDDLLKDPQGIIYPLALMVRYQRDRARLRWVYYLTRKTRKAWAVTLDVTLPQATERFAEHILPISRILWKAKQDGLRGADMPQNPNACEKYGGCAFRGECNLSPRDRMEALMSQWDLNAQLQATGAAQQHYQQAANQVPALPQPGAEQPMGAPNRNLPGGIVSQFNPPPNQPPPGYGQAPAPQIPAGPPSLFGTPAPQGQPGAQWGALPNAPPQAPSNSALSQPGPQQAPQQSFTGFPTPAPMPQPQQPQAPQGPHPSFPEQQYRQPLPGAQPGQQQYQQVAPSQAPQSPGMQSSPASVVYDLYIDCRPLTEESTELASVIGEWSAEAARRHGVQHDYRLVEYGKGAGELNAVAQQNLSRLAGNIILRSSDPAQAALLSTLIRSARFVAAH